MKKQQLLEVKEKLLRLNLQTSSYINEIKKLISEQVLLEKNTGLLSYFTYSLNISHHKDQESLLIGSYHIQNLSNQILTNLTICIQLSSESSFHFSGKYIHHSSKRPIQPQDAWQRINEQTNNSDFWLKPIEPSTIMPNEKIIFSNFQVKWLPTEAYAASILGFAYTDQYKEGIAAINPIYINGSG